MCAPKDLRALAGADGEGATVPGDPEALQRMMDILRDNALWHGRRVAQALRGDARLDDGGRAVHCP